MNQAAILNILLDSMINNHRTTKQEHILRRIFGYKPNLPGQPSEQTNVPGLYLNNACYYGLIDETYLIRIHINSHFVHETNNYGAKLIDSISISFTNVHNGKQHAETSNFDIMLTSNDIVPEGFQNQSEHFIPFILTPTQWGDSITWCPILTDEHYNRLKNHIMGIIYGFVANLDDTKDSTLVIFE